MQLIVLGMYRSGTSLATRILNKMGAYVPPECFSDSPDIEAPREDWDKQDIRKLNNSMLLAANAVWHRIADFDVTKIPSQVKEKFRKKAKELVLELDTHRPWVINDPRLCLIFPLLRPLLELPICILVHRKPIQVAQSLQYHDGFPITFGMALWEKYTLSALTSSVGLPRVSLCFEKIMDNPLETIKQLHADLYELKVNGLSMLGEEEIKSFVDADLHGQHGDLNLQESFINVYQDHLYKTISGERIEKIKSLPPLSLQALEAMFHFEAMEKLEADKKRMQFEIHEQNDALRTALLAKDKELIEYKFQVDSTQEELNKYQAEIASTKEELKTCENETERFRTLVLSKEQALSYKEKELMSVQNEIMKLKRKLHEVDMAMQAQAKKLNTIEGRSEQRKYSIHKLSHWLNKLDSDFKLLKSSRRWQMGNALIRTMEVLLLRRKAPIVTDHIAGIFAEFEDWKNSEHSKKKTIDSTGPQSRSSKYGTKLFYQRIKTILTQNPNRNMAQDFEQSEAFIQESLSSLPDGFAHPLVSIIMPTYNRAHIISDSIQSALDQSYNNWELWVCDDASTDNTEEIVKSFDDPRIKYLKSKKVGAARARNIGLSHAKGAYIGYLDSDNIWHPEFLNIMVHALNKNEGMFCAYSKYVDIVVNNKSMIVKKFYPLHFNYEALLEKNFIDLNLLVHRRELYDNLGGFNSKLARRQDYDLILKYTFLRDPHYVDAFLMIYQRNKAWKQITQVHKHDDSCIKIINDSVDSYFRNGLPMLRKPCYKSVTVLSWDICRNHFSKAYNMAECLAKDFEVQLIGFRFFEGRIFPPYENESPSFETLYLEGEQFPKFSSSFEKALASIKGDIIYAVKPRLASFGLALLANYHFGKPVVLEINDLESVVTNPTRRSIDKGFTLDAVDFSNKELLNPYSDIWSKIMEKFAFEAPILVTHNKNIDAYFGSRCFHIRNHKDEAFYDPDKYDRDEVRKGLGFSKDDRIILFGGMLRRHKGIFELVKLIKRMDDHRYKLLFVGSRITPDQKNLESKFRDIICVLPPQGRNDMAKINLAADLVIVWLDPSIAASHYQMPYKITDAFAMGVPVIANNVSDMGDLARDGYLRLVDYDDFDNIVNEIESIFDEPEKTKHMVGRARRLYQRQFSYSAARTNFHLISDLVAKKQEGPLEVSREFADFFSRFSAQML